MLRTALRCDDPVLFLEHKKAYRLIKGEVPDDYYIIPFGKADVKRQGTDVTVITYGALVQKSLQAALQIERKNPRASVEVIDLRTLAPYDWECIRSSVERTNRALIVHEDCLSFGYGAEIAARIAEELFDHLDAPVRRVAALDTWVGYHPQLEYEILPQIEDIAGAIEALLAY